MKNRLIRAFNKFANQSIIYKRAVLQTSELKSFESVASYQEFPISKCIIKSAKPDVDKVTEETHYGLRLNIIFLSESKFEVGFHDRVKWENINYRITDFKNLEQITGLHRTVLEIEKL